MVEMRDREDDLYRAAEGSASTCPARAGPASPGEAAGTTVEAPRRGRPVAIDLDAAGAPRVEDDLAFDETWTTGEA